eukprot:1158677-Pelagomonas_calceolata.AAC.8
MQWKESQYLALLGCFCASISVRSDESHFKRISSLRVAARAREVAQQAPTSSLSSSSPRITIVRLHHHRHHHHSYQEQQEHPHHHHHQQHSRYPCHHHYHHRHHQEHPHHQVAIIINIIIINKAILSSSSSSISVRPSSPAAAQAVSPAAVEGHLSAVTVQRCRHVCSRRVVAKIAHVALPHFSVFAQYSHSAATLSSVCSVLTQHCHSFQRLPSAHTALPLFPMIA